MKLKINAKNETQIIQPKWYDAGIVIHDITGDSNILIVRILDENDELKGLWLERKNDEWYCLQEDIDDELVQMVLKDEEVKKHLYIL